MLHAAGTSTKIKETQEESTGVVHMALGCMFVLTQVRKFSLKRLKISKHTSLQVLCSVIAGVYNEYLIKGDGADIHIMIQNVFMYLDSILCNAILLGVRVSISDRSNFR